LTIAPTHAVKVPGLLVRVAALAWTALAAGAALATAPASAAVSVSSNWAGYAVTRAAGASSHFSSVSGSWTQPSASCSIGNDSYSAVWVGLGGFSNSAHGLEQIGTEADCTRSGAAAYSTWLELVPATPVDLKLKVRPGDQVAASVTVAGHGVTMRIRDLSTGASFASTRRMSDPDVSSAEWIVEAPSVCLGTNSCATLALTNFGTVTFSSASASAGRRTGPIDDPDWSATELELRQGAGYARGPGPRPRFLGARTSLAARPSSASSPDGSFSVTWQEQTIQSEQPPEPAPGF
jgi:Peptidase A4 family